MYEDFFVDRLTKLRCIKNVSAREMSLSIGQNRNYINDIENKRTFPSMQVFFYICEYLNISPHDFFDEGNTYPNQLAELINDLKNIDKTELAHISGIVKRLANKK